MVLRCSACQATYRVDAERVQNTRLKVRCPGCGHVFRVRSAVRQPAYAGGRQSGGTPSRGLELQRDDRRPPQVARRGKLPRLTPSRPLTPPTTPKPRVQPQTELPRWDRERTIDFNSGSPDATPPGLETAPFQPGAAPSPSQAPSTSSAPPPARSAPEPPPTRRSAPTPSTPTPPASKAPGTPPVVEPRPAPVASTPAPPSESARFQLPSGAPPPITDDVTSRAPVADDATPTPTADQASGVPTADAPTPNPVLDDAKPTPQPIATPLEEPELEPPPIGPLPTLSPREPGVADAVPAKAEPIGDTTPFDLPTQAPATQEPPPESPLAAPDLSSEATRRAHRLARVLVSDILVYNQDVRDRALREGNLASALGSEINKAWELYKTKVDARVLHTTSYFKDALNEILADGQSLF